MKTFQLIKTWSLIVAIACISPGCENTGAMGPQGVTQAIVDRGGVAVYAKAYKDETLLGTYKSPFNAPLGQFVNYSIAANTITVFVNSTMPAGAYQFRHVLIPGSVTATAGVNLQDYNSVKAAFSIAD